MGHDEDGGAVRDEAGRRAEDPSKILCDVRERREPPPQDAPHSLEHYRSIFEFAPIGYLLIDQSGVIVDANRRAQELLASGRRVLRGLPLAELVCDEAVPALAEHVEAIFETEQRQVVEVRLERGAGDPVEVHLTSRRLGAGGARMKESAARGLVAVEDISARKSNEQRLHRMTGQLRATNVRLAELAHVDPLTQLGNRRAVERNLAREVGRNARGESSLLALLIDCDDFKRVNDQYGHAAGDHVLQTVARRLRAALRPSDHLGRIGGDEFLAQLSDTSYAEGLRIADRLRAAVSGEPINLSSDVLYMTMSLGVARIPPGTTTVEEVLSLTGLSLQRSKRAGKDRASTDQFVALDNQAATGRAVRRFEQGLGLRAICQPIFELGAQNSPGRAGGARDVIGFEGVIGFELLTRTDVPDFEMPAEVFRAALEASALPTVDLHCLRTCAQAASGLGQVARKHLNIFPATLLSLPTVQILETLAACGAPEQFCIELSEQQMVGDPAALRRPVELLREAGVSIAIDDVGFGRASLETLILLEPDFVKIDQRFTRCIVEQAGARRALGRLVNVLASLGVVGVATGIESEAELAGLHALGVSAGQGYLLGVPQRLDLWSAQVAAWAPGRGSSPEHVN